MSEGSAVRNGAVGVLRHDVTVRVLDVSPTGCLLETNMLVESGTHGTLRIVLDGRELVERITVVRCQPLHGAGTRCLVGVRFSSGTTKPDGRLQAVVSQVSAAELRTSAAAAEIAFNESACGEQA